MPKPTIEELDALVESYRTSHQPSEFSLELWRVPPNLRSMIELYLPSDHVDRWLQDKEAFEGKSALDYLSELETSGLRKGIDKVVAPLYEVLAFASVPPLPTTDEVLYAVREAQCQQLWIFPK